MNANTQHTPGPWKYSMSRNHISGYVLTKQNEGIAKIVATQDKRIKSNLCLIAAAPELLEACKTMLGWLESHYTETMNIGSHFEKNCMRHRAQQAITKAEGR